MTHSPDSTLSKRTQLGPVADAVSMTNLKVRGAVAEVQFDPSACTADGASFSARENLSLVIAALKKSPLKELVVDLSTLNRIDSETVGLLLSATHKSSPSGAPSDALKVTIIDANQDVFQKLKQYGLTRPNSPVQVVVPGQPHPYKEVFERVSAPQDQAALDGVMQGVFQTSYERALNRLTLSRQYATPAADQVVDGPILAVEGDSRELKLTPLVSRIQEQTSASRQFGAELEKALTLMEKSGAARMVINCEALSGGLGADAIGMLITTSRHLRAGGGALALEQIPEKLWEQLKMTKLVSFFGLDEKQAA